MVHNALILQLEQQILDLHTANRSHRESVNQAFQAQEQLRIGSDEYNKISSEIHALFNIMDKNLKHIEKLYKKLEKLEVKQYA